MDNETAIEAPLETRLAAPPQPTAVASFAIRFNQAIAIGRYYLSFIRRRWYLMPFLPLLVAGYFGYKAYKTKPLYTGRLAMLQNTERSASDMFGGMLGLIGGGGEENPMKKTAGVVKEQMMMTRLMFKPMMMNRRSDLLINHYIDEMELHKTWQKSEDTTLQHFTYIKHNSIDSCTRLERTIFKSITAGLRKNALKAEVGEEDGILSITLSLPSEQWVVSFLNGMYEELDDIYNLTPLKKPEETIHMWRLRQDSISAALNAAQARYAYEQDHNNMGGLFMTDLIPAAKAQQDIAILASMKVEAIRAYETAKMATNVTRKDFFIVLEYPIEPLERAQPDIQRQFIFGLVVGLFLTILLLVGYKWLRDTLDTTHLFDGENSTHSHTLPDAEKGNV